MSLIQPTRRQFIASAALLFAAPAIVRFSSIMPVRSLKPDWVLFYWEHAADGMNYVEVPFNLDTGYEAPVHRTGMISGVSISGPLGPIAVVPGAYRFSAGDSLRVSPLTFTAA